MRFHPRFSCYSLLLILAACNAGNQASSLAGVPVNASLLAGELLQGKAAKEEFIHWQQALPPQPILPLQIEYVLQATFKASSAQQANVFGTAKGSFFFQGLDQERARLDTNLQLKLPQREETWQLHGTTQFDGFFLRAWGKAKNVPEVPADQFYAVQLEQTSFRNNFLALEQIMPTFFQQLRLHGVPPYSILQLRPGWDPAHIFHPQRLQNAFGNTLACQSLQLKNNQLHASFQFQPQQQSQWAEIWQHLMPVQSLSWKDWDPEVRCQATFEARTGIVLSLNFTASFASKIHPQKEYFTLTMFLDANNLSWSAPSTAQLLQRPKNLRFRDLTPMMDLATKFIQQQVGEAEAEKDFDF